MQDENGAGDKHERDHIGQKQKLHKARWAADELRERWVKETNPHGSQQKEMALAETKTEEEVLDPN
jgi:hypothetical protein